MTTNSALKFLNPSVYRDDIDQSRIALAAALRDGALSLFLGAGVSQSFGLPGWDVLVNDCRASAGEPLLSAPSDGRVFSGSELAIAMDPVQDAFRSKGDPRGFLKLVHDNLYKEVRDDESIMYSKPLLSAISALMMGSSFGRVRQAYTTNYDNYLERYLTHHGFRVRSVVDPFGTLSEYDAVVYHPHGYLPQGDLDHFSKDIVFSNTSYNLLTTGPWPQLLIRTLCSTVPLFIGASARDQMSRFYFDQILSGTQAMLDRPVLGFVCLLIGPDSAADRENDQLLINRKLIPMRFSNIESIPKFLFNVCRTARGI